jgi:FlgD Ig-like domain
VTRLGRSLFLALLIASVGVAAVVVHARTPNLALEVTRFTHHFSPNGDGHRDTAHFRFFVRESDDSATVEIVDTQLNVVRTLAEGPLEAKQPVSLTWNGRTDAGALANPQNQYQLRVVLPSEDRDMLFPRLIRLHEGGGG